MAGNPGPVRVGVAQGTTRYVLDEKPLHGGDIVALCCSGGWLTGRFEQLEDGARFFFSIEIHGGGVAQESLLLPVGAIMRRP